MVSLLRALKMHTMPLAKKAFDSAITEATCDRRLTTLGEYTKDILVLRFDDTVLMYLISLAYSIGKVAET